MAYVYCGDTVLGACGVNYISPGYSREFTCTVNTPPLQVGENVLTVKVGSQNDEGTVSAASVTINCKGGDVIPQTQTWEEIPGAAQYIAEYSTDDFEHVIQLTADSNSLDAFQLPEGTYQMRVKPADGEWEWTVLEPVAAEEVNDEPKLIISNADGNTDVFFANAVDTWGAGYAARHVGSTDTPWSGTQERVKVFGRNKLTDIIEGSSDANVLLMTDDDNGDALFVDDIYSASPDERGLSQSRIARTRFRSNSVTTDPNSMPRWQARVLSWIARVKRFSKSRAKVFWLLYEAEVFFAVRVSAESSDQSNLSDKREKPIETVLPGRETAYFSPMNFAALL